jgi:hypothetical protein
VRCWKLRKLPLHFFAHVVREPRLDEPGEAWHLVGEHLDCCHSILQLLYSNFVFPIQPTSDRLRHDGFLCRCRWRWWSGGRLDWGRSLAQAEAACSRSEGAYRQWRLSRLT